MQVRITLLMIALLTVVPAAAEELLFSEEGPFGTVVVTQDGPFRMLKFRQPQGDMEQSRCDVRQPARLLHEYTQFQLLGLLFEPQPESVLVVGLGGASLPKALAELLPQARITSVEIDPLVAQVARRYFFYTGQPVVEDARAYLSRSLKTYDLVVLDAFDGLEIPDSLRTVEFYQLVRSRLNPGGVVVSNLHLRSELYSRDRKTLQAVFPHTYAFLGTGQVVVVSHLSKSPTTSEKLLSRARQLKLDYPLEKFCATLGQAEEWDRSVSPLSDRDFVANSTAP